MKTNWKVSLIAIGLVLICLSPTVANVYANIASGLAFIGLGIYLVSKDSHKVKKN